MFKQASRIRPATSCLLAVLLAGACASGNGRARTSGPRTVAAAPGVPLPADDTAITHLLNRIAFGPRPGDVDRVKQMGVAAYIEQQLHPEQIPDADVDAKLDSFETLGLSSRQIAEQYYQPAQEERRRQQAALNAAGPPASPAVTAVAARPPEAEVFRRERLVLEELSEAKVLRAVESHRQLQEVLVDFWFNHFNVFAGKGADRGLLTAYERDTIRPHVLGRFRDLLGATAESPAMLFYLDNWLSVDPNGPHAPPSRALARRPVLARGLRPPATAPPARQRPAAARRGLNENYARELMELHTLGVDGGYTQRDVVEVARCFTGWTLAAPRDGGGFRFDERLHDEGQKVVLGHVIKPGGGERDGEQVLDILARHPSTARFIATALVRRFVSDTPPASLVDRVAARFRATDGDLREVVRAIITAPEFSSAEARRAKVKTPLEYVASALRATLARIDRAPAVVQALRQLGMPPYFCLPPTGYADRSEAWSSTGGLVSRMNFAVALVDNRLPGIRVDLASLGGPGDPDETRSRLLAAILGPDPSAATRAALDRARAIPQFAALALASPEFQRK